MIIQGIETRYLRPTNNRGSRIKATAWSGSVIVSFNYGLSVSDNHRAAAQALIDKFGWEGDYAQGANSKGDGYLFVCVSD